MATISINPVTGDDVITAIEQAQPLLISGTTTGVPNTGTDLLTNPEFDAGLTGWTLVNGAVADASFGQVSISGTNAEGMQQDFATVAGQTYTISIDVTSLSGQWYFLVEDAATETIFGEVQYLNSAGTYYATFTATDSSTRVFLGNNLRTSSITLASISLPTSMASVELNGRTYQGQVVDGAWSVIVPVEDVAVLQEGFLSVRANVSAGAGDTALESKSLEVNTFDGGTVAEHAAIGTVVATLTGVDVAAGHGVTIYDDAGGRFAVVGNQIVVKNGAALDFEQTTSHTILVTVSDGTSAVDKLLTINLTDVFNERAVGTSASETIIGGLGADVFRGMGGNDRLIGAGGNDVLIGGTGNDRLEGGSGADRLYGQDGRDVLLGGSGNDRLYGGRDADRLYGQDGNDLLRGDAGNDRLDGGRGSDNLQGGSGNDTLVGSSGNDVLTGGRGRDIMSGGSGRDRFVFDDRDTGASTTSADYILDFRGALGDRLDLRRVDANSALGGDQAFTFIGTAAFTAAGQVRYEKTGTDTWIYLNTDADGTAEGVIRLRGAMDFAEGWILL